MGIIMLLWSASWGGAAPWYARVWQVDKGLPGDSVTGVAQTQNGFLWISTQAGLARFDGLNFQRFPMPTGRPHRIVRDMFMDRAERLWLAEESGVLVRYDTASGNVREFSADIPKSQPTDLAQSGDGSVWVAYADGSIVRVQGEVVRRYTEADGFTGTGGAALTVDAAGNLWFFKGGPLGIFTGGKFVSKMTLLDRTTVLLAARGGGIWIAAGDQLLRYTEPDKLQAVARVPFTGGTLRPTRLLEDRLGAIWIGTMSHGLFHFDGTMVTPVETSHGRIKTIAQDREESIWVGTDGGGLNRLRPQVLQLLGKDAGLPFDTVRSTCEDADGNIWVVTQSGNLAMLQDDGRWRVFTTADGWQGASATCVTLDHKGVLLIGTFSRGIHRWQNGKFLSPLTRVDGLARLGFRGVYPDRRGNLWIAASGGEILQRYRDGVFQDYALPAGARAVRTLTEDAAGNIWMANLDAQLLRVDGDKLVDETGLTSEPTRTIRCLVGTPDGSLWIGYSVAGLGRLKDGKFTRITRQRGLLDDSICSLMPDDRGWLWVGSDHGIFRVKLDELIAAMEDETAKINCISHGGDDGYPSLQAYYGYFPGATRTRAGNILIPTHTGLAIVRPDLVQTNFLPPPVIIQAALLDNRELTNLAGGTPIKLPPGHRRVEFRYTAPSFIDPDNIRFRVKLEGWDEDWVDVGRERATRYPQLSAGKYHFRARAENTAGILNESGAGLPFEVTPYLWQRWWFVLGVVALFTSTVFVVARYVSVRRLRLKVRQLEQENALQRERARIAQDIHDDIGARLTQISLLAELTQKTIAKPEQATAHVGQIAGMTRQGMKALDEIVWAVNPRNDTLQDLLDYGAQYALDFLGAAGIRCRVDFPAVPLKQNLPADVRHALLMVLKEALNNVVKHAQATEVWLRAGLSGGELRLEVADNGRGFGAAPEDALADGLRNMRERLAEFGGNCTVLTQPGAGVKIAFTIPETVMSEASTSWSGDSLTRR
jgi:signal transduction histidine kinase/ligand-binding sensor domain-containing protein